MASLDKVSETQIFEEIEDEVEPLSILTNQEYNDVHMSEEHERMDRMSDIIPQNGEPECKKPRLEFSALHDLGELPLSIN